MRKLLLLNFIVLFSFFASNAQNEINFFKAAAMQLVEKNKAQIGITDTELANTTVSSTYTVASTGMTMVYLQQTYKGIPVSTKMKVLAFMNGNLVSNAGVLLDNMDARTGGKSAAPSINADQAVRLAFTEEKIAVPSLVATNRSADGQVVEYGKPAGVTEKVTAALGWFPVERDDRVTVQLGWEVLVAPDGSDDTWLIRVDAGTGQVIEKVNMTIYETFEKPNRPAPVHRELTSAAHNWRPKFGTSINQQRIEQPESPSIVANASYNVIPFPLEAPSFGAAAIRNNPWTAAPGNATSLGWHNDGATDYTMSRGNNVWASEDTLGTDQNTTGISAESTTPNPNLTFNFTPNFGVEPSMNSTMQKFCITNLFYWANITHDLTYQYGFDEVSGNFQANNQGRGGAGNDFVKALAQSGLQPNGTHAHIGNNANFATGPDGGLARMRMYLFSNSSNLHVNAPGAIAGDYACVESGFSQNNKLAALGPITGDIVYYDDGGGLHEACGGAPVTSVAGKIALIDRGTCPFVQKALNAQAAGAIAVIVTDNVVGNLVIMAGDDNTITIPAVFISQADGITLKSQLASGVNVTLSGTAVKDGDLDAGIMVHEYTHGISNRLTGGPSTASCLNNAEQGGEGWSDYFALMLTTNWATATTTDGANPRPVGTYVIHETPTGEGIRNYPYTTNIALNPLTYAHMGLGAVAPWLFSNGNEVHNIGEIWCVALWEMTWNIIQQENAINTNFYNYSSSSNGGNTIAFKLVMEGLRLQPCSPGFIDARNAILTADMNLYGGRHQCAIWTAFAKRGMGYGASQGTSTSTTNQTAAFDLPPAPTITTQPVSVTVNPGDNTSFTVAVTAPVNGANMVYNWQVSTDGGASWNNLSPAVTTATLNLTAVTVAMNGNKYRCIISQGCANTTSNVATLTVNVPGGFTFTTPPATVAACPAPNTMDVVLGTTVVGTFSNPITVSATSALPAGTTISFIPSNTVTPGNSVTVRLTGTASLAPGSYPITITGTATGSANQTRVITYTINPGSGPAITVGPSDQTVCAGGNASFSITSAGATSFTWQLSTDGGGTWTTISNGGVYSNATTNTLNITGATIGMNGNRYRCNATTVCGTTTSTVAILTVNSAPTITGQPANASICAGSNTTFSATATGSSLTYQWYISTDGGGTFNVLPNGGVYSGATTATLSITGATIGMNGNQYRVQVTGVCPVSPLTSNAATLTVGTPVSITSQPVDVTICAGNNTSFSVTATGATSLQWQVSTDGGGSWTNITNGGVYSNATTSTLNITGATAGMNGNKYRCVVTSGCGNVNSSVATLTVNSAPAITSQPSNTSACTGGNATFTATVTGSSLTYQWYISTDGGGTFNILPNGGVYSGATTASLTITGVTIGLNGNQYRLQVTGVCPVTPITSNNVTLTVATSLSINTQPSPSTVCEGANTSFSVSATGAGTYQWQISTDGGGTWSNLANGGVYSNVATSTLNLTGVTAALNGNRYRCAITSTCGNANSNGALLTVNTLPAITSQPANATLCAGANNTFSVTATGTNLTYQWEISSNGCAGPWTAIPSATSSSFTLSGITAGQNNTGYRCVVSGTCTPAATSNCALLTVVTSVTVTGQPSNQTVCEGGSASFTVTGGGSGILYQWQVSTDGGATWTNVTNGGVYSNATTATLNITGATAAMNNYRYRCLLSNATCTTPGISNAGILTVNTLPAITGQPSNASICVGANTTYSVTATGTGVTYQWQVSTSGCAGTFTNIINGGVYSGATSATLTITGAPVTMNGYAYKCVVSGTCTPSVTSSCATLAVGSTVSIATNPANQTVCAGDPASFTVAGTGSGILYQWQASSDGGVTWFNIAGATNATFAIPVTIPGMNNTRYRAQVSNAACSTPATSTAALLTVNSAPSIVFSPTATICLTDPALTLAATPAGGTFAGTGVTGSTFTPSVAGLGVKTITYTASNSGCTSVVSRTILVNECTERHLLLNQYPAVYVYPIPNQGDFSIRMNTDLYSKLSIRIINNLGQVMKTQEVSGLTYGSIIPIHTYNLAGGTYQLYLTGEANGKVSTRTVPMIIGQ